MMKVQISVPPEDTAVIECSLKTAPRGSLHPFILTMNSSIEKYMQYTEWPMTCHLKVIVHVKHVISVLHLA